MKLSLAAMETRLETLERLMRDWLPRLKVIVDHAPKPLDGRAYAIFEEMENAIGEPSDYK